MSPEPDEIDPEVVALATRLFDLARRGVAADLAAYLDAGVPVDLRNQSGDSLLMLAAYHGRADAVAAIAAHGADVNLANDRGQSPLAGAVFKGHDDVVTTLLEAGADPHAGTPTAHDTAVMFGRDDYLALWNR
ncbi:ankyrin repeat domain-containing protein [Gordonia sp. i37]|uniref:ankyrin repeat domain-containing protein n=1 Tax=Gordonia sp. i37 TaxID=1961707 RepID=UPI0009AC4CBD|nr:ankyrin repeat domain-containing protein [Gordonia sp. i37]OPX17189.1 hypothetical protein B1964_00935 [Gordonia sp. i37]